MAGAKLISKALQAAREAFSGRNVSPLGFYSKGAEEAAALRQPKGTPEQMRSMLINKQGVKATELDNAGFNDAFAGRPSVTREEIAKLLQDRAPKIEERVLGGKMANPAKYSAYQLPGGENYREAVLKLPSKQERDFGFAWFDPNTQTSSRGTFASQAEAQAAAPQGAVVAPRQIAERNPEYKSSHWDDPNVLAHLRMSDRTDPTGRKILHLEELQSDWAQEGRKMGFLDPQIDQSSTQTLYDAINI